MTERTIFDPDSEDVNPYQLLTALVVPRPIAWISTVDSQGRGNLAPHSFFTVASHRPPTVSFTSVGRKDTLRNVEETGEFVVSLATEDLLEQVNASSAPFDPAEDEAQVLGLAMEPSQTVAPPRVALAPASIECRLDRVVEVGKSWMVLGRVTAITVADDALVDGHPEMSHLRPLSRLGRDEWGRPPEVFRITRPASPDDVR